jgi:hypothetical protein
MWLDTVAVLAGIVAVAVTAGVVRPEAGTCQGTAAPAGLRIVWRDVHADAGQPRGLRPCMLTAAAPGQGEG